MTGWGALHQEEQHVVVWAPHKEPLSRIDLQHPTRQTQEFWGNYISPLDWEGRGIFSGDLKCLAEDGEFWADHHNFSRKVRCEYRQWKWRSSKGFLDLHLRCSGTFQGALLLAEDYTSQVDWEDLETVARNREVWADLFSMMVWGAWQFPKLRSRATTLLVKLYQECPTGWRRLGTYGTCWTDYISELALEYLRSWGPNAQEHTISVHMRQQVWLGMGCPGNQNNIKISSGNEGLHGVSGVPSRTLCFNYWILHG